MAGRAKALGEVDLVAVTCLDVALYLVERCFVLLGLQVTDHRCEQPEVAGGGGGGGGVLEQPDQALAFVVCQARVEHQLAGAEQMIADQCPGIQAQLCVWQAEVVHGQVGRCSRRRPKS